ncbi:MAG: hypothetical protein LBQ52_04535 [Helicobacteraceae bacterium]|jgi:hypothetical protein|nr:hypothetical protein [Helicobacteraceae bacterium]
MKSKIETALEKIKEAEVEAQRIADEQERLIHREIIALEKLAKMEAKIDKIIGELAEVTSIKNNEDYHVEWRFLSDGSSVLLLRQLNGWIRLDDNAAVKLARFILSSYDDQKNANTKGAKNVDNS